MTLPYSNRGKARIAPPTVVFSSLALLVAQNCFAGIATETQIRTHYSSTGQSLAVRNSTQLLKDNFEDGYAQGWSPKTGVWNVVTGGSNATYRQTVMGLNYSSFNLPQSNQVTYDWEMTFKDGGSTSTTKAGLRFLAKNGQNTNNNSYLLWQTPTQLKLLRYKNNQLQGQKITYGVTANTNQKYAYRVSFDEGVINVWRDGELVLTWTDPSPKVSGSYIGLRTNNSKVVFDNVRVTSDDGLTFLHADVLGSANALSDAKGNAIGQVNRFYPFGEYRTGGKNEYTEKGFTGHKENRDIGLTYMNARFYIPGTGRFATADSVIPGPTDPQAYNRYSYVRNNPILLTDPSGHCILGAPCPQWVEDTKESLTEGARELAVGAAEGGLRALDAITNLSESEGYQNFTTGVSVLPIVGDGMDVMDIGIALYEQDYQEAGTIAALALVPGSSRILREGGDLIQASVKNQSHISGGILTIWEKSVGQLTGGADVLSDYALGKRLNNLTTGLSWKMEDAVGDFLVDVFDLEEMKQFAFDLGINDNIIGHSGSTSLLAEGIMKIVNNRGQWHSFLETLAQERAYRIDELGHTIQNLSD
ncbi:MAG: RHS repeat-associated core domain-containing protein [Aestuariibacter sp.]